MIMLKIDLNFLNHQQKFKKKTLLSFISVTFTATDNIVTHSGTFIVTNWDRYNNTWVQNKSGKRLTLSIFIQRVQLAVSTLHLYNKYTLIEHKLVLFHVLAHQIKRNIST